MQLLVMAKAPVPGKVKTRLCPPCTPAQAADLATAALRDTLDAALASNADEVVLALEGDPGDWLPSGVRVIPQSGRGLDERLAAAWSTLAGPAFQVGMDTPQITGALLDDAFARLSLAEVDATLGLAADGGWWGIGLRCPDREVFLDVPMSTDETGRRQVERLSMLDLETAMLDTLIDVDTIDDAYTVAARHPSTRFAVALRSVGFDAPATVFRAS